jgi:death-on-curing family protein
MKSLSVIDIEHVSFKLAREVLAYNEPIPEFQTRFPNRLESCLAVPFQTFSGKSLYKGLIPKASILFYLLIKNHPFQNGNKRIAMTSLFVFLYKNNKWLKVDAQELYNFTMWVTTSPPKMKKETVESIEKFIKEYLVNQTD